MAHDIYRKKDKMELAKTNPRTQSFGALSSSDMQYKSYLAGMKPRSKTPGDSSNNLKLSADVNNDLEKDTDKIKANRSMYTEISSVPTKKTNDLSFERGRENPRSKPKPDRLRAKSSSFDEDAVKSEATLSVGKLRSMFDSVKTTDNANKPQLRNTNVDRRRDNLKRYSALEPIQRVKHETKKVDENVIGNKKLNVDAMMVSNNTNENELPNSISPKRTLNIDAMLSFDDKAETDCGVTTETNPTENESPELLLNNSTGPLSITKGMHGLLQRKGSEFDDFEDRIIPTGTKTIDISSMLAPSDSDADDNTKTIDISSMLAPSDADADDNNNHQNENILQIENKPSVSLDFDLQKKRELDRLMQAQEEVTIHKAFNIKRKSLKDKLSEMSSMNQDSFDHGVVPYELVSQPIEHSPINIHSYVNSEEDTSKISSVIDTHDKHSEIINEPIVSFESEDASPKDVSEVVDTYVTSNGASKNNAIPIECSKTIIKNNTCNINEESLNGIQIKPSDEGITESNLEKVRLEKVTDIINTKDHTNITLDVENVEITPNKDYHNGETLKIDLSEIDPNKMNISLSESDSDSEEMAPDKSNESIVERFDAFLTSHGHGIAGVDPDILLSPTPIPPAEVDVKLLTAAILDSYKLETVGLSNAESNERSPIDDEISSDISDNLSFANEKISDISDDLSLLDEKMSNDSGDISITDEVINFDPAIYCSQGDDVELKLPNLCKQDKIDLVSPDEDLQLSYEVGVSKESALPIANVADEIFSEESAGVVGVQNKERNLDENRIIANSLHTESYVPNIVTDPMGSSETVATMSDINKEDVSDYNIIMENKNTSGEIAQPSISEVLSTHNTTPAVEESTNLNSSNCISAHQVHATLASFGTNDQVISGNISTNATVEKQKPSVGQNVQEKVCSESINNEVSSASDNDCEYQVTESIKSLAHSLPKKSNLIKSKSGAMRKVNFREPLINDVILTYGPREYDRANADIDPIASSAEWELEKRVDKMDVFSVDLQKDERGLGLSIIGLGVGTETGVEKLGIFVKTLTENGASQKDGRIQVNDQILEVNGISLVGVTQYFAAQTLKNTDGIVRFLMGREKSRHYSPGAPLAVNPEMHAEERAHEAEQQEQLTAVTGSPLIGTAKKLKNEIKKKGGKHEKLDTLQQSLTQVTNKLSISEESLAKLQNQNKTKDKEIVILQQRISDLNSQMSQMENSSNFLHNEIGCRTDQISSARLENGQLKEQLNEINNKYEKEKENLVHLQVAKTGADVEEKQSKVKVLENENKSLKDEVHALTERLEINKQLLEEASQTVGEDNHIKHLECKINEYKTELENSNASITTLKEKNEYLQALIVKLERRGELAPEKIDIERRFSKKEEEYIKQNDILHGRIFELENQLQFSKTIVHDKLSPAIPIRGYVNIKELNQPVEPPEISRNTKPCTIIEPNTEVQINVNNIDDYTNLLSNDSGVESINNIDEIDIVLQPTGNDNTVRYNTEDLSLSLCPNPVPKPERGNFINIDSNTIKIHDKLDINLKDIIDEPSELLYPIQIKTIEQGKLVSDRVIVSSSVTDSRELPVNTETLQQNINSDVGNTVETTTDSMPVLVTSKNLSKISSALNFDLDDLPEWIIDNESDEDQGQFQLIHEEDIEEEQQTPAPANRIIRLHSDLTDNRIPQSDDSSFNKWLGRLDSTAREEHADLIAAQVTAGTPDKRKYSNTSSTSSEEAADINACKLDVGRIDSLYFKQSSRGKTSFDMSIDEGDESVTDSAMEIDSPDGDITRNLKKSLSLDIAIPPTPVLENKGALDKKALKKNKRTKPSRSPQVAVAAEVSKADGSETRSTSALPHHYKPMAKIKAAQSVPNLSLVPDSDKPSKRKHKYVFNLPKAFKKTKLGKRMSQDSFNKRNKETTPSLSDTDVTPVHLPRTSSDDTDMHSYTPSVNVEAAVVPMAEKTASLNQEKANDAATEEAVVPFADKERLMKRRSTDTDLHVHSPEMSSLSTSPASPQTLSIAVKALSNSYDNKLNGQGNPSIDSSISSSPVPYSKTGTLEYEFSSYTASPVGSMSPESYNERGVDIEMSNGNTEEDTSFKMQQVTNWDVKQVGQWLTEIKMTEYANSFKLHNVNGSLLLKADGRELKEYGVHNHEHRSQIKKYIKEFRLRYGKSGWQKVKDHKSTKDKLQFWKGK